ncbi:MAG: hypothetical protein K0R15_521 [Clostridiales bacterium]|jgi:rod shape-determining protein MreD|nr:hypothetical protein [Clostridiales bacterium]
MKRIIVLGITIFVFYILQVTVFNPMGLFHISPNLIVILVVTFALLRGNTEGAILGFFCGFILDIFYGDVVGLYSLLYAYIGYLCGYLHKIFYKDYVIIPLLSVCVVDFFVNFIIYVFTFLLRGRLEFNYYLMKIMIPEILYTLVVTIILYKPLIWLNDKLETNHEEEV